MNKGKSRLCLLILFLSGLLSTTTSNAESVWVLHLNGPVSVAASEYVISGIDKAHNANIQASLIILKMDTPGGLDSAMRVIIKRILSSQIPVVGFVSPQGARAASAGTFILYACHIAAMSHATTLGAATPVNMTGPSTPNDNQDASSDDAAGKATSNAIERKVLNDAVSYIEGLAVLRNRNREWAIAAVRSANSLESEQALKKNVINLLADSVPELIEKLHGTEVSMGENTLVLNTQNLQVTDYQPSWRHNLLAILTNPNIAYLLLIAGIYGLFFEVSNPGFGLPGILGALCILMALYAFQLLPVNYTGVAIMIIGIGLVVAEAFAPSFGVLGIGGIIGLMLGSLLLFDSPEPTMRVALPVIISTSIFFAIFVILTLSMIIRNRKAKTVSGAESLCGATTTIESFNKGLAMVRVQGELWQVSPNTNIQLNVGDRVEVLGLDGLSLNVKPIKQEPQHGNHD